MNRQTINRLSAIAPLALSLTAFGVAVAAVLTGWGKGVAGDEGAGAHIFQLLVVAEVPFILIFVATAEWTRALHVLGTIALHCAGLVVAFAPVALFKL
ncbi:MAG: hypothetical protein ABR591_08160 [Candidatus Velthaea sp.]